MGLKHYRIDASVLPLEERKQAVALIERSAWTLSHIPHSAGCFDCYYEERDLPPTAYPLLSRCIIEPLP